MPNDYIWLDYIILAGAVQGLILALLLRTIRKRNKSANVYLELLMIVNALFMLGRTLWGKPIVGQYPLLIISLDIALFFYTPLFYCYIKALYLQKRHLSDIWHFAPGILFVCLINPFMEFNFYRIREDLTIEDLQIFWLLLEGFALVYSIVYVVITHHFVLKSRINPQLSKHKRYISIFLFLATLGVVFWILTYIFRFTPWQFLGNVEGYSITWIYLVIVSYGLAYFMINYSEVFRVVHMVKKYAGLNISPQSKQQIIDRMEHLMKSEKPYLNPRLTLNGLSEMVGVRTNVLSMIINENLHRNFHDYINSYRVEEFKQKAKSCSFEHWTLEAIAKDSGFRSKSAFHKYFRKANNELTPTQYLNRIK